MLWFKCNEIIPGTAIGVAFIGVALSFCLFLYETVPVPDLHVICRMSQASEENLEVFRAEKNEAFVLGYTGEVGKELIRDMALLKAFSKVYLIGRRFVKLPDHLGPEFEQVIVDFDDLDSYSDVFRDVKYGFCCLGTTRAKSGKTGFVKVDHDYVLKAAELAKASGCKHYSVLSSQGADKNSSLLYPRTKGQVEEALKVIHFRQLSIFRPGLILCNRQESRPSETFFKTVLKPMSYFFPTAVTTPVQVLARAMINDAIHPIRHDPVLLYENRAIHFLSGISKQCS
ncbi:oxidoreductase HTATIP2-like [Ylistrum balloti]|uniref:oxidoreductase HTATIP2-like n=1 Tax=Ylistrum balloti TaxID=509963 RepID=UPI002905A0E7|nr:oxidoreductase HTATIP2-like [Ylistrum balloti]